MCALLDHLQQEHLNEAPNFSFRGRLSSFINQILFSTLAVLRKSKPSIFNRHMGPACQWAKMNNAYGAHLHLLLPAQKQRAAPALAMERSSTREVWRQGCYGGWISGRLGIGAIKEKFRSPLKIRVQIRGPLDS
jgi:hypothetical protein